MYGKVMCYWWCMLLCGPERQRASPFHVLTAKISCFWYLFRLFEKRARVKEEAVTALLSLPRAWKLRVSGGYINLRRPSSKTAWLNSVDRRKRLIVTFIFSKFTQFFYGNKNMKQKMDMPVRSGTCCTAKLLPIKLKEQKIVKIKWLNNNYWGLKLTHTRCLKSFFNVFCHPIDW